MNDTLTTAPPTAVLWIEEPTEYVDRNLPTASAWVKHMLEPGVYPFEWVDINYFPWNPDPAERSPGMIANTGPYYGLVTISAREVESYYVSRLFTASSVDHKTGLDRPTTITKTVYAYQLPGSPKQHGTVLTEFLGGQVHHVISDDPDDHSCIIACLHDESDCGRLNVLVNG